MGKTITIEISEAEATEMQREIEQVLRETNATLERIRRGQQEIEPLKASTQANLEWLRSFKIAP